MPKNFPATAMMYTMLWVLMLLLPLGSLTVFETHSISDVTRNIKKE
jgi:hypothetical protein